MMQQSHSGMSSPESTWDRLAIVVDKTKSPKVAKFYQLEPGGFKLELDKQKEYRASCFMCHANGPRAIRPDRGGLRLSLRDEIQIAFWNLKVKTYGRVILDAAQEALRAADRVPLRYHGRLSEAQLQVQTCLKCHREKGLIARGLLTRQNALAIEFMVEKGYMPPLGFSLRNNEKEQIEKFIQGF
jgi:hypothetical protein